MLPETDHCNKHWYIQQTWWFQQQDSGFTDTIMSCMDVIEHCGFQMISTTEWWLKQPKEWSAEIEIQATQMVI
jgi:hypothetical protein